MKLPIAKCLLPIEQRPPAGHPSGNPPSAVLLRRTGRQSAIANDFAFTLIEIMIVVGIIGLIAAMGAPSIGKAFQKEGMRKAVSDVQDVFFSAREQAIVGNKQVAVIFYPRENRFGVEGTAVGGPGEAGSVINVHSGKTLVASLPPGVQFGMLEIFRQDYVQSPFAKIFFNADGTSDEAVIVLLSKGRPEKITLEYATGMPVISSVDQ